MKDALARFSASFSRLGSTERWFVIVVIIGLFAIINFVFIFPRFGDWGRLRNQMDAAQGTIQKYENMIGQMGTFSNQIARIESANAAVPLEDQAVNFLTAINNEAVQSRVSILSNVRQPDRTNNTYFIERAQSLTTQSGEKELVDFLYNLGAGDSMIRVRNLTIGRDPSQQQLKSTMVLVASFQKKPTTRSAPRPAAAPAAKPKSSPKDSESSATPAPPAGKPAVPAVPKTPKPATPQKQ